MKYSDLPNFEKDQPIFECIHCNEIYLVEVDYCEECGSSAIDYKGSAGDNLTIKRSDKPLV